MMAGSVGSQHVFSTHKNWAWLCVVGVVGESWVFDAGSLVLLVWKVFSLCRLHCNDFQRESKFLQHSYCYSFQTWHANAAFHYLSLTIHMAPLMSKKLGKALTEQPQRGYHPCSGGARRGFGWRKDGGVNHGAWAGNHKWFGAEQRFRASSDGTRGW